MDLKRLKYFCAVVEHGSISKAAQALHISQPPLSKRLQELEEEVCAPLFLRQSGKIEPTPTGFFLYNHAVEVLKNIQNIERETQLFAGRQTRTLKIGLTHLFQRYFQPLLIKLHQKYPHLEIGVVVSDSSHLETLLHNGVIDIALIQRPYNLEGYDCISFPAVNAVVVAHNSLLEGFNEDSIHLNDLGRFPLVLLRRINGTGTFEFLQDKLRKNGVNPNVIMHISQPNVILDWLESGVEAASLLPESEVRAAKLAHCRIIRLLPEVLMFFPTLVKLAATPEIGEILAVLEEGYTGENS